MQEESPRNRMSEDLSKSVSAELNLPLYAFTTMEYFPCGPPYAGGYRLRGDHGEQPAGNEKSDGMPVTQNEGEQVCLTLDNVWFCVRGKHRPRRCILSIREEELVGIAGPNGSGKSTLMKIMVGLLKPDKGTVAFTCHIDECEGMTPCRPCIGYVPQNPVIRQEQFPFTAREVVEMGTFGQGGLFRRMNSDSKRAVGNAIAEAGLENVQHELFSDLSGGQQQRTLIARALVGRPHIIALDEPTNGVDAQSKQEFYKLVYSPEQSAPDHRPDDPARPA